MTRRERLGMWLGGDRFDALGSVAAVILTTAPLWGPVMFR